MRGETIQFRATPIFESNGTRPNFAEDLRTVVDALGSRWKLILAVTVLCLMGGIAFMWQTEPTYRSTVDILVDPRARTVVGMDVVPAGLGSSSQGSDSGLVDSQVQLLQSRAVLGAVITQLHLADQLDAPRSPSLLGTLSAGLKSVLYGPNRSDFEGATPLDRAMAQLQSSIKTERVGNTYVLRVTVSSTSPQSAADIANAIAATYVAQGQQSIDRETAGTAEALEARLSDLKRASDKAQLSLEQYRSANGLLGVQGTLVGEQQLHDLNDQVTKANVDAEAAKARLAEIERVMALPASSLAGGNTLSSPAADTIRTELDTALSEESSLAGLYGPKHPTLIQARQRRMALEQSLRQEFKRIEGRAASDYKTALGAATALKTMLGQYEARSSTSNEASIRLRELQTAADTARGLYDAFSLRAAQTREQTNLPTNTARVIASAEPSSQPSDPKLVIVLAISGALGLVAGLCLAWLLHLLESWNLGWKWPFRAPLRSSKAVPVKPRRTMRAPVVVSTARTAASAPSDTVDPPASFGRRRPLTGLFR